MAPRASSTPASRRKASSAVPLGSRSRACCRCRRSSSANTPIRPPSSSTTAARCAGARAIASPHRWWYGFLAASSNAATPGTVRPTKSRSCTPSVGEWRCRRMRKMPTGLLRAALRGNDPTLFFEHRALLDGAWARRPYPGDEYVVPFGVARRIREGTELSIVTWGAMVERCERAAAASGVDGEILDLRTLSPWDKQAVLASVEKTHRCLDRARGQPDRGLRGRDRGLRREGGVLQPGCSDRQARDAGHPKPAQSAAPRGSGSRRGVDHAGHPADRERLSHVRTREDCGNQGSRPDRKRARAHRCCAG